MFSYSWIQRRVLLFLRPRMDQKIAQRFNAGLRALWNRVPQGRQNRRVL